MRFVSLPLFGTMTLANVMNLIKKGYLIFQLAMVIQIIAIIINPTNANNETAILELISSGSVLPNP